MVMVVLLKRGAEDNRFVLISSSIVDDDHGYLAPYRFTTNAQDKVILLVHQTAQAHHADGPPRYRGGAILSSLSHSSDSILRVSLSLSLSHTHTHTHTHTLTHTLWLCILDLQGH